MNITFENIKQFSVYLDKATINHFFSDEEKVYTIPDEHRSQIFMFEGEGAQFLWDYEHRFCKLQATTKYFQSISDFNTEKHTIKETKKYLYNLGIPFNNWVFITEQRQIAFMLTWKMVIKYHTSLFFDDYQTIWDKTSNWRLDFCNGIITFGKDLIFNANIEGETLYKNITEMMNRKY